VSTTDELPLAAEITETPTTVKTMVQALLKKPDTVTACALIDLLDEENRGEDARALLAILRRLCATSLNGARFVNWTVAGAEIGALFWFDLHGFTESLDQTFGGIKERLDVPQQFSSPGSSLVLSGSFPLTASSSGLTFSNNPYAPRNG